MRNLKLLANLLVAVAVSSYSVAQTGPGGVKNSNGSSPLILWLDASHGTFSDAGSTPVTNGGDLQQWNDLSGYNHHSTQTTASKRPSWNSSVINGLPAVDFDATSIDYLSHSFSLNPANSDYSFLIVFNIDGGQRALLQQFDSPSGDGRTNLYINGSNSPLNSFLGGGTRSSSINYQANTWTVSGVELNSNGASSSVFFHVNGANGGTVGGFTVESSTGDWIIGANKNLNTQALDGYVAEMVMFDEQLSSAELIIVQNYLAAKYNLALSANDFYDYQSTHSGDVIGIGRASDGSSHTSSTGRGILTISNPSSLSNNEFLFVGHNQNDITNTNLCADAGAFEKRLDRVWRTTETGSVGTIDMSFNLSDLSDLGSESELVLLISSNSSLSGATVHKAGRSLVGNTLSFTGVNLSDGDYFTIAEEGVYYSSGSWSNGTGPTMADANRKIGIAGNVALSVPAACECLNVEAGSTLTISAGQSLTVHDEIVNQGNIALPNSASLVQTSNTNSNSGSGTYSVSRITGTLVNDTRYQFWSSPVSGANMGSVFTGSNPSDFYFFNEASQSWASQGGGTTMVPGRGYATTGTIGGTNYSETRTFSGSVNNAAISLSTSSVTSGDVILVGNPYPCALSSQQFVADNSGIDGTLWFWNHTTDEEGGSNISADYATWNSTGSTGGNAAEAPDDYIQSCQGFYVEAATSNPTISFRNSQRVSGNNTQFYKKAVESRKRAWLSLTNDSSDYNQLLIGFLPDATEDVDRLYDGKKFKGHARLSFYSKINGNDYAIQGLPLVIPNETKVVPLGVDAWVTGEYTILLDSLDNWSDSYKVSLEDKLLNTSVNLKDVSSYSFMVDSIGVIHNRFYLNVHNELGKVDDGIGSNDGLGGEGTDNPTGIEELTENEVSIFRSGEELVINSELVKVEQVTVFDLSGRVMLDQTIETSAVRIPFTANGMFIVTVKTTDSKEHKAKINF